jgi:hypothetical protein
MSMNTRQRGMLLMRMKKWKDLAVHRAGCPYKGVAVYGSDAEIAKYHSGNCPGCNVLVKWEEEQQERSNTTLKT